MNRRVQSGAGLGLWALVFLSWVLERPELQLFTNPALLLGGIVLPLGTLFLAWKQRVQFLYSCGVPLSLLPFILLYPEAMSHHFHSPWTYIPMGLLWFLLVIPPLSAEEMNPSEENSPLWASLGSRYLVLPVWFVIGVLGIFLGRWLLGEDTSPIAEHWFTLGAVVWSGPLLLFVRYRRK